MAITPEVSLSGNWADKYERPTILYDALQVRLLDKIDPTKAMELQKILSGTSPFKEKMDARLATYAQLTQASEAGQFGSLSFETVLMRVEALSSIESPYEAMQALDHILTSQTSRDSRTI